MTKIRTYDPKKSKLIMAGEFDDKDKSFYKKCKPQHFMKIVGGYGIQEDVIQQLKEMDCEKIYLTTNTGKYVNPFKDWLARDIKVLNYGHGKQRFFPLSRMERVILTKESA